MFFFFGLFLCQSVALRQFIISPLRVGGFRCCRGMVDADTLRILVATDCHLGYMEKDEVRRHDSFNAFDEICAIASQRQASSAIISLFFFFPNPKPFLNSWLCFHMLRSPPIMLVF